MIRRIYTVKLPTDGATNVDIPVEGPFAAAVGAASTPTAVGADGFFAEWRNRPLLCPNKLSLGAAQFIPRFRLGFDLDVQPLSAAPVTGERRQLATGSTDVGAGATVVVAGGAFAPLSATSRLSVSLRVTDAVNVGGFGYGAGPRQAAGPVLMLTYISAELRTAAAGAVDLALTNNDAGNAHTVAWTIWEEVASPSGIVSPHVQCSQSLVGNVLTTVGGAVTTGDGGLADPANRPTIRIVNGFDVAGLLMRLYLGVAAAADEDHLAGR